MSKIELTDGSPVPEDGSHKRDRGDGQQVGYVVLTEEERRKGFVKPVRRSYTHDKCGGVTTMGRALCETYARDPYFYSGTFCCNCGAHFPLNQFHWEDGEPMDPSLQEAWGIEQQRKKEEWRQQRIARQNGVQLMTSQENPMLTTDPLRRWKCESYCTCGSRKGHFELRDTGAWVLYTDAVADREAALKDLGDAMQGRIDALVEELHLARLKIAILQDPDDEPTAGNVP